MPPKLLFDLSTIDLDTILHDKEAIREVNPQRGDMEHLDAVTWCDPSTNSLLGFKNVRDDEFWVPGHIPGRPLLPGVLMLEAAAQLASFYTKKYIGWEGFIGFGGVEGVKFRGEVRPGQKLWLLAQEQWRRHRRVSCLMQGVVEGNLAFEAEIVGVQM